MCSLPWRIDPFSVWSHHHHIDFGLRDYGTAQWDGGDPACDHRKKNPEVDQRTSTLGPNGAGLALTNTAYQHGKTFRDVCGKCGAVRIDRQMGLEPTLTEYIDGMVQVFRSVRDVLADDGVLWLNCGDSYASAWPCNRRSTIGAGSLENGKRENRPPRMPDGLKEKDLMMVPARLALALQEPYTVPCIVKDERDRAWLAAMFDGEGCIGIRRFNSYRKEVKQEYQDGFVVYTSMTNNDLCLLDRCIEITGKGKAAIKQRADATDGRGIVSRFDSHGWRLDGNSAVDVIRAAYPYLIAKRNQAILAYTLDVLNKTGRELRGNGPVPADEQAKRALLHDLIKRANQREHIDIPSWCVEPAQKVEPGWYLRSDIIWAKKNCMPESVTDRPTSAHEHIFLLTKSARYFYNADAIAERSITPGDTRFLRTDNTQTFGRSGDDSRTRTGNPTGEFRNSRNVWTIATQPFSGAHFATFPPELPRRCILAGSREGDTILDPFAGAGTTLLVADQLGRNAIGIELNPEYAQMARERVYNDAPLLTEVTA